MSLLLFFLLLPKKSSGANELSFLGGKEGRSGMAESRARREAFDEDEGAVALADLAGVGPTEGLRPREGPSAV